VIAAEQSGAEALAVARAAGEAMGKTVIDAPDVAGFLVNRCNRPFSLESLKLLEDGIASPAWIDAAMRGCGGFRMGPFELMDLVGIDTNHLVAEAMWSAEYGEPRYRPSPLAARMVAAGRLGRKTGRGWYEYGEPPPPPTAAAPQAAAITQTVVVRGDGPVADALREGLGDSATDGPAWLTLDCAGDGGEGPVARLLWDGSLHATNPRAVGFHVLAPLGQAVEYTVTEQTDPVAVERFAAVMASLGRETLRVGDAPGLVCGRVVCQLINEAHFMVGSGRARADDVDVGMTLGLSHPRGPFAWCERLGPRHVVGVLDALHRETGEPRYRVAPALRRRVGPAR
jgi:3-hydroxybutyryl-CoA dehydrogenase